MNEVSAFVSNLATRGVSASTQNQALSAVLFLYEVILGQRVPWMDTIVRAQRPVRLPVVLSRAEVSALLSRLRGHVWLMASLMYEVPQCFPRVGMAVGIPGDPVLFG